MLKVSNREYDSISDKLSIVPAADSPRLLDRLRARIRVKHYSLRTETAHLGWARRFILFHDKRHPAEMGKIEVEAFLSHLATEGNLSASTQTQALSALLFLYKEVLETELPWLDDLARAKKPVRLPTVLTQEETLALLGKVDNAEMKLTVGLLLGSGLRLLATLGLRDWAMDRRRAFSGEAAGRRLTFPR